MAGKLLNVEVVSPEKRVWSGKAQMISARTLDGDIGILPDHTQFLGVLVDGTVVIKGEDGTNNEFSVRGGFISVAHNQVSLLAETTE